MPPFCAGHFLGPMTDGTPYPPNVSLRLRNQIEQMVPRLRVLAETAAPHVLVASKLYAEFHTAVTSYAWWLKEEGLPPERMLSIVKSALTERALASWDTELAQHLIADVVTWSIDSYYDGVTTRRPT
jgi:hypothetical protein